MASLVENFIRRIEKLLTSRASVPLPGTNHVNDDWQNTDIYPGEFASDLTAGYLYTSDGEAIIDLNRENLILSGLSVSKDTSGVLKLTVSSGYLRINGRSYYHDSSGTDILFPANTGADPILYFVYGETTTAIYGSGASGNYQLSLGYAGVSGSVDEPGIFTAVSATAGNPALPANSLLLGTLLLNPGATGFDLWPLSVTELGDYYPKFSTTPSEFLRSSIQDVVLYEANRLYFPDHIVLDSISNTLYRATRIFVSDPSSLSNDIAAVNLLPLGSAGGPSGASGSMTAINVGTGVGVYKTTIGSQFQFRSIGATGPIQVALSGSSDEIYIGLSLSGIAVGGTNIGSGSQLFSGTTGSAGKILQFRSLTAGNNISIGVSGDNIIISGSTGGSVSGAFNRGTTQNADVYAGLSGADLTFRRLAFGTGMSGTQTADTINIFTTVKNNDGVNRGAGPGQIYGGMSGDSLIFRTLTGSGGITITTGSDVITINGPTSGTGGSSSVGINVGYAGSTVGQVFAGMSGPDLTFRSIVPGSGIVISYLDANNIEIESTATNGAQGFQGWQGPEGFQGWQGWQGPEGFQGWQGWQGPSASDGYQGFQGFQGDGYQGFQGAEGPAGTVTPLEYIEIYDSSGGWEIFTGGIFYVPFDTTRFNSNGAVFSTATVANVTAPVDGTGIIAGASSSYLVSYTITGVISSGVNVQADLYNFTTSSIVPGARVHLNPNGPEIVSASTKATLAISSADTYCIRLTATGGAPGNSMIGYLQASNFSFMKLEALGAFGPTGPTGPIGSLNYTSYVALLTQGGTAAPTAIVLENTLSGTPTFEYLGIGSYAIRLNGEFDENKTFFIVGCGENSSSNGAFILSQDITSRPDRIVINTGTTTSGSSWANDLLYKTPIEIRVYP